MKIEYNKQLTWSAKSFNDLSTEELYRIIQLRVEVFVVEQDCPYQECDGLDQKAIHFYASNETDILAYMRIIPGEGHNVKLQLGRILTKESARALGLGKELMTQGLKYVEREFETTQIKISAQTYLLKFYESFGFVTLGGEYLEDDIPHITMIRS